MAEFPALPLWTDAYLGDTTHLSTIEHGAYLLLLMTAWRTRDCRLPDDDRLLARYARLDPRQWKRMRPVLAAFFMIENGTWRQGRLDDEAKAVRERKHKAASAGRASALKRQGRHATDVEPEFNGVPTKPQPEFNLTSTSTIPLREKESLSGDRAMRGTRLPTDFEIPLEWIDWAVNDRHWSPDRAADEAASFVDYWHGKSGKDATKVDWDATWRHWVRNSRRPGAVARQPAIGI